MSPSSSVPELGLLLDLDGAVASPVTRSIAIPSILTDLVALAGHGTPIVFNTGRSDEFVLRQVVPPLVEAGLPADARVFAVCEKGAVWFPITAAGAGPLGVDASMALPGEFRARARALVAAEFADAMFYDETKRAMVSVEQRTDIANADYLPARDRFDERALGLFGELGLGAQLGDVKQPGADGAVPFRIDPTIISTDIEHERSGKDLGARRAVEYLTATGPLPRVWRTVGDSRTDYAMADWLHARGHDVAHLDVRPSDGLLERDYPVLTADGLVHDEAVAVHLARWAREVETGGTVL